MDQELVVEDIIKLQWLIMHESLILMPANIQAVKYKQKRTPKKNTLLKKLLSLVFQNTISFHFANFLINAFFISKKTCEI